MNPKALYRTIIEQFRSPQSSVTNFISTSPQPIAMLVKVIMPLLAISFIFNFLCRFIWEIGNTSNLTIITSQVLPIVIAQFTTILISSIILNKLLSSIVGNSNYKQSLYWVEYASLPMFTTNIVACILYQLSAMITCFGLYSLFILWQIIKSKQPNLSRTNIFKIVFSFILMLLSYTMTLNLCKTLL
ncbi:MAG: hypothetical protein MJ069_00160 [Salinivirgaceae bacterium]|nr:hypothetical protein [Salinivirgaceae bacterium]